MVADGPIRNNQFPTWPMSVPRSSPFITTGNSEGSGRPGKPAGPEQFDEPQHQLPNSENFSSLPISTFRPVFRPPALLAGTVNLLTPSSTISISTGLELSEP